MEEKQELALMKDKVYEILKSVIAIGIDEETSKTLQKRTESSLVKHRPDGKRYVAGKQYIYDLIAVDPNYEWKIVSGPEIKGDPENAVAFCIGNLTIKGITRSGAGSILIKHYRKDRTDELSGKMMLEYFAESAETKALKRAAEKFGLHLDVTSEVYELLPADEETQVKIQALMRAAYKDNDEFHNAVNSMRELIDKNLFNMSVAYEWENMIVSDIYKRNLFTVYTKSKEVK